MHRRSSIVASLVGLVALSLAPTARADGFFVTFSAGQRGNPGVARIAGAAFDATGINTLDVTTLAQTGQALIKPVHVEVDDVRPLAPLIGAETKNETIPLVTVEFTAPDAAGKEQVYMIGNYVNCNVSAWQLAFDPQAAPTTRGSVDFLYQTVTFTGPPKPKFAPPRPVAREAPLLRRGAFVRGDSPAAAVEGAAAAVAAPVPHIDDAYLRMPPVPGESVDHPGQIKLTAFTMTVLAPRDPSSGRLTGTMFPKPIKMSKAGGAASLALQNMFTQANTATSATVTFNQHRAGTTDLTLETLVINYAKLNVFSVQVSGAASGASMTLSFQTATLTDNRTGTSATVEWPPAP
jgi:type VI protein secretion system component Hcp